jgi:hypothetical protein
VYQVSSEIGRLVPDFVSEPLVILAMSMVVLPVELCTLRPAASQLVGSW